MSVEIEDASGKKQDVQEYAVEKLAAHLEVGISLTQLCEVLSGTKDGDRLAPIHAAARMMRSVAAVAAAMASVGKLERPRRPIAEPVQKFDPEAAELNSTFQEKKKTAAEYKERTENMRKLTGQLEALLRLPPEEKAKVFVSPLFADLDRELTRLEQQEGARPADG
jgi:hypothetical protein